MEAAHRRLPRRPRQLGGGVAATETVRKNRLGRKKKEVRRKAEEARRGDKVGHEDEAGRGDSARGQCAEDGVQHAEVDQPRRTGQARVFFASAEPYVPSPPPSISSPPPLRKFQMETSERRQTFLPLSFFLPRRV